MKKSLAIAGVFIGILAYNVYVPEKNTTGMRPDEAAAYVGVRRETQFIGLLVGGFFGGGILFCPDESSQ
jgi:hypothetical protein